MLVDCHMHTPLCGHAVGDPLEYAMVARERGIELITVTCHIPMEWSAFGQAGIRMERGQLDEYFALVREAADKAESIGVEILCGIEAEVFPDERHLEPMDEILAAYDFHFVLGSLHAQCQSYLDWLKNNKVQEDRLRIDCYFRHLIDGAQSGRYDSMSHPDVIRTYGVVRSFDPQEHEEVIREFLQTLVDEDVCMEVNTSGLTKGDFEVHPRPADPRLGGGRGSQVDHRLRFPSPAECRAVFRHGPPDASAKRLSGAALFPGSKTPRFPHPRIYRREGMPNRRHRIELIVGWNRPSMPR